MLKKENPRKMNAEHGTVSGILQCLVWLMLLDLAMYGGSRTFALRMEEVRIEIVKEHFYSQTF